MSILITVLLCFHILFILHKSWIAVLRTGLFIWLMPVKSQHLGCQNLWKRNYKGFRAEHHVTPQWGNWFSMWTKAYWEEWAHVRHGETSGKGCWATWSVPLCMFPAMPGHVPGTRPCPDTLSELTQSHSPAPSHVRGQGSSASVTNTLQSTRATPHLWSLPGAEIGWTFMLYQLSAPSCLCGGLQGLLWGEDRAAPCWTKLDPAPMAPSQGTAEPSSQAAGVSWKMYLRNSKSPHDGVKDEEK